MWTKKADDKYEVILNNDESNETYNIVESITLRLVNADGSFAGSYELNPSEIQSIVVRKMVE